MGPHLPNAELIFKHWLQTVRRFRIAARLAQPENGREILTSMDWWSTSRHRMSFRSLKKQKCYDRAIEILKT